jgi:hypothetical protein
MSRKGLLQSRRWRWGFCEKPGKLLLRCARQPEDLNLGNCLLRGFLGGGDDKIADRTPLNLGGAPDDGQSLGRNARLQAGGSIRLLFRHGGLSTHNVRHFAVQVKGLRRRSI